MYLYKNSISDRTHKTLFLLNELRNFHDNFLKKLIFLYFCIKNQI